MPMLTLENGTDKLLTLENGTDRLSRNVGYIYYHYWLPNNPEMEISRNNAKFNLRH